MTYEKLNFIALEKLFWMEEHEKVIIGVQRNLSYGLINSVKIDYGLLKSRVITKVESEIVLFW